MNDTQVSSPLASGGRKPSEERQHIKSATAYSEGLRPLLAKFEDGMMTLVLWAGKE